MRQRGSCACVSVRLSEVNHDFAAVIAAAVCLSLCQSVVVAAACVPGAGSDSSSSSRRTDCQLSGGAVGGEGGL